MKYSFQAGRERKSINFFDNIVYSCRPDLNGNEMELKMSIMLQNGNSEAFFVTGCDDEDDKTPKPAIVWVPGGGYRGSDKNLMAAEMAFLADAGFVVASIYYRSSAEAHLPSQIEDVKTAIRFLRAHADEYEIDPDHIGIIGRSAGGHLSALAAMNQDLYDTEEWSGYSSKVQACCDMFGPVNFSYLLEMSIEDIKTNPNPRWTRLEDTHGGAVIGGDPSTMVERGKEFTVNHLINDKMCPMLILHGDHDRLVPSTISDEFYDDIVAAGFEDRADYYILEGAGHGSKEFFQNSTKRIIRDFFVKNLKNEN